VVGLGKAARNRGCRSASGVFVSKGRKGAAQRLRDNVRDFQSYRRLARALAISEVVSKFMAIEATGEEATVCPPVGGR
jgi:hypothetical protein